MALVAVACIFFAAGAEAIFIVVADPPTVQSVLDQIPSQLGPGNWVIHSITISAKWTLDFARTGTFYFLSMIVFSLKVLLAVGAGLVMTALL